MTELSHKTLNFPDKPGVYIMKNERKKIIYVGKAKSIRKRVRSYFSGPKDIKTRVLMEAASDIDFIVTRNEYEALILENNLIKQWSPRFNIRLKDGKTYPVIRITNEPFPRVFKTRRIILDGSEYFGPFPDGSGVDLYVGIVRKMFPLRRCKGPLKKRGHPCLYYHIRQCSAPCCGLVTEAEYAKIVDRVRKLLSGKTAEIRAELDGLMREAADALRFEDAALQRDRIAVLEHVTEVQRVTGPAGQTGADEKARDYIGLYTTGTIATFVVLKQRGGNISGREIFQTGLYMSDEEALEQFVLQYYGRINIIPTEIYLPIRTDTGTIEVFFREKIGTRVSVKVPSKGPHMATVNMAIENAREDIESRGLQAAAAGALDELKRVLDLPMVPFRIEGFDISHLAGKYTVASMVSFQNGLPDRGSYRHFKMRSLDEGEVDDYGSIREAVARRYTRVLNEGTERPDLVLIDGGLGQVNAASRMLKALGLADVPCIGLAKKNEEIFFPGSGSPLVLERTSGALRVLQAVRDESHRFATSLNKRLRKKSITRLMIEEVPGIGPAKSTELLRVFGSIGRIMEAGPDKVAQCARTSVETATKLVEHLKAAATKKADTGER